MRRDRTATAIRDPARADDVFALDLVLISEDDDFAERVQETGRARGHRVTRVARLCDLRHSLTHRPAVLVLDLEADAEESARLAATITAIHDIPIVLAAAIRQSRTVDGFRVLDKHWSGDRVVDELELAHIGIPASIKDHFG